MTKISPIERMKILSYYKEIKEIFKGNMPAPRTVEFFISDKCNHNCIGCHSKMLHDKNIDFMDINTAKKVIDELTLMDVEGIEISGGGEPLLYPHIIEFMEHINSRMIKAGMITNGTLISKKLLDPILKNLLFIRIALDAGTSEMYKKIHGVDQFELLKNNINCLIQRRKELNLPTTIGLKYLISKFNYSGIIEGAKVAKSLGVDYVQFKALRRDDNAIENPDEVNALIEKAKKLANDNFQVLGSIEKSTLKTPCILTPMHPLIDASGNVYLCAFWQYRQDSFNIGNVHEKSFKEIWYSDHHREVIKSINVNECNHFDCPLHAANHIAHDAIKNGKMHLEFI
jgi:MoaA/NifB/PqqE/SkfB family radical SAM enzyme